VIGADLESLITTHDESSLEILFVLEESNIASTTFFPFAAIAVELEELGPHLEDLLLRFFVGLGLDLLGKVHNGFEVDVGFSFIYCFFLER
jgi:hypothetical protein